MGLSAYQQYAKKKPLDVDMSKLKMNLGQGAPLAGQGMSLNPSAATARVMPLQPSREQAPYQAAQPQAPGLASGLGKMMATFRGAVQANTVNRAAQESAANVRDVAAPWAPSSNGSLASIIRPASDGRGPGDSYQVPGLGAPQSMYYSAPQQRQTASGTPDQSLNYGYEDRRATWYPQLSAEQRARAPWLNAGNDGAFKRALEAGFSADELTDATPWEGGQRFTPSGQRISLGQARLEGSVPPGYKPPAAAQAPGQQAASGNTSALRELVNPYNEEYRQRLTGAYQQTARDTYAKQPQAIREAFASRGLSQGGVSGIEAQALAEAAQQFQRDLGGATDKAYMETVQAQNDYGIRRALGLDTYDLANRGLLQGDKQFTQRLTLDEVLGKGGLANDTRRLDLAAEEQRQTLPGRAESIQVGNEATRAATDRIRRLLAPELRSATADADVAERTANARAVMAGEQARGAGIANEQAAQNLQTTKSIDPLKVAEAHQELERNGITNQKLQEELNSYRETIWHINQKVKDGQQLTAMELQALKDSKTWGAQAIGLLTGIAPGVGSAVGAFAGTESGASAIAALLARLGGGGAGGGMKLDTGAFGGLA